MSSINPGIIGSVAQSSLQQSQVARARDKRDNERAEHARELRDQYEHHLTEVEDSGETDDDRLHVRDEDPNQNQREQARQGDDENEDRAEQPEPDGEDSQEAPTESPEKSPIGYGDLANPADAPAPGRTEQPPGLHLDVEA